jgi:hypothetical protein
MTPGAVGLQENQPVRSPMTQIKSLGVVGDQTAISGDDAILKPAPGAGSCIQALISSHGKK